jgi:hypothetical protein
VTAKMTQDSASNGTYANARRMLKSRLPNKPSLKSNN